MIFVLNVADVPVFMDPGETAHCRGVVARHIQAHFAWSGRSPRLSGSHLWWKRVSCEDESVTGHAELHARGLRARSEDAPVCARLSILYFFLNFGLQRSYWYF